VKMEKIKKNLILVNIEINVLKPNFFSIKNMFFMRFDTVRHPLLSVVRGCEVLFCKFVDDCYE
jgi:hypothetical protein